MGAQHTMHRLLHSVARRLMTAGSLSAVVHCWFVYRVNLVQQALPSAPVWLTALCVQVCPLHGNLLAGRLVRQCSIISVYRPDNSGRQRSAVWLAGSFSSLLLAQPKVRAVCVTAVVHSRHPCSQFATGFRLGQHGGQLRSLRWLSGRPVAGLVLGTPVAGACLAEHALPCVLSIYIQTIFICSNPNQTRSVQSVVCETSAAQV